MRLSEDLPVVIEIIDSEQKISTFLPVLDKMIESGLVTLEKVHVLAHGETRIEDTSDDCGTGQVPLGGVNSSRSNLLSLIHALHANAAIKDVDLVDRAWL